MRLNKIFNKCTLCRFKKGLTVKILKKTIKFPALKKMNSFNADFPYKYNFKILKISCKKRIKLF